MSVSKPVKASNALQIEIRNFLKLVDEYSSEDDINDVL